MPISLTIFAEDLNLTEISSGCNSVTAHPIALMHDKTITLATTFLKSR